MANITYYEISCGVYDIDGTETVVDNVKIQISKRVNKPTMRGLKAEVYNVPIDELPYLFGAEEFSPPKRVGNDCSKRIAAVREFIDPYVARECYAEEVTKGKTKILTSLEFRD